MNMNTFFLAILGVASVLAAEDNFTLLISPAQIQERIAQYAAQIDADYQNKEIVLVMVMKGAICIASDLIRAIKNPCSLEYVQASSYGQNGETAGALTLTGLEKLSLEGKHVLLVDDIFDKHAINF